ncbi:MAG: hypothetical protein F6K26_14825 [Moorea sp. SIO2I5]|nr:hypothetical protein [Moorena sp. SIO2I5]
MILYGTGCDALKEPLRESREASALMRSRNLVEHSMRCSERAATRTLNLVEHWMRCSERAATRVTRSFRAYAIALSCTGIGCDARALSRYANAFYSNDVDRLFSTLTLTYSMLPNFRS